MTTFNETLEKTEEIVDMDIEYLKEYADSDAVGNYLYFLRDKINAELKKENRKRRREAKKRSNR